MNLHDVIEACQHLTLDPGDNIPNGDPELRDQPTHPGDTINDASPPADLLTYATNRQSADHIPPAHLAKLMSDAINKHHGNSNTRKINVSITHYGTPPIVYSISRSAQVDAYGETLIDGGSNGGLAGKEMRVIETYDSGRTVDIEGIDRHQMCQIPL